MASVKPTFLAQFEARLAAQEEAILGNTAPFQPHSNASDGTQTSIPPDKTSYDGPTQHQSSFSVKPVRPSWATQHAGNGVLFSSNADSSRQSFAESRDLQPTSGFPSWFPASRSDALPTSLQHASHSQHQPLQLLEDSAAAGPTSMGNMLRCTLNERTEAMTGRPRAPSTGGQSDGGGSIAAYERQNEQIRSLLATLQSTTEDAARQRQAATEAMRSLDSARRQASDATAKAKFLEAELEGCTAAYDNEVNVLKDQVDQMQSHIDGTQSEIEQTKARAEAAEERAALAEARLTSTPAVDELELLRVQREHAAARKEIASTAAKVGEAQSETAEARAQISALQSELRTMRQRLEEQIRLEEQVKSLTVASMQARELLQRVQSESGARITELQRALTTMSGKLAAANGQASKAQAEAAQARSDAAEADREAEGLAKDLVESRAEIDHLRLRATLQAQAQAPQDGKPQISTSTSPRSPSGVRFNLPGSPLTKALSPVVARSSSPSPGPGPPSPGLQGTEDNLMALMLYAQKLEEAIQTEKRRTAAAQIAFVLSRAVHRAMQKKWRRLGGGSSSSLHAGGNGEGEDEELSLALQTSTNLEMLASTPLTSLGLQSEKEEQRRRLALQKQREGLAGGPGRHGGQGTGGHRAQGSAGETAASGAVLAITDAERILIEMGGTISVLSVAEPSQDELRQHLQKVLQQVHRCKGLITSVKAALSSASSSGDKDSLITSYAVGATGSDSHSRLRAALSVAHERADKAESDAGVSREECTELRVRLTALQTSVKGLLAALGQPQSLAKSSGKASGFDALKASRLGSGHGHKHGQGVEQGPGEGEFLHLLIDGNSMDAGLLDASFADAFGSPVPAQRRKPASQTDEGERKTGAGPSDAAAMQRGTPRRVQVPSPEAVLQATNAMAVLKLHLASLVELFGSSAQSEHGTVDSSSGAGAYQSLVQLLQPGLGVSGEPQALLTAAKANPTTIQSILRRLESAMKESAHAVEDLNSGYGGHGGLSVSLRQHDEVVSALSRACTTEATRLKEAEASAEASRRVREDTDARLREYGRLVSDLQSQLEASERMQRMCQSELDTTRDKLSISMAESEGLKAELDSAKTSFARSRTEIENLKSMMRETLVEAKRSFHSEVETLIRAKDDAQTQAKQIQQQLEAAKVAAAAEQAKLKTDAEAREGALSAEFQRQLSEAAEGSSIELDKRLAEAMDAHDQSLALLQQKHKEQLQHLEQAQQQLQHRHAEAEERLRDHFDELQDEMRSQTQALEQELATVMEGAEGRISQLAEQLKAMQGALIGKEEELASVSAEFEVLQARAEQMSAVLGSVTSELETQMMALEAAKAADGTPASQLEQELSEARQQLHDLRDKVRVLAEEMEDMREQHSEETEGLKQEMAFAVQASEDHAKSYVARMLGNNLIR